MKKFLYVRCEVGRPNQELVAAFNAVLEKLSGEPLPDVIPDIHPGGLRFKHVFVKAESKDKAYTMGPRLLPPIRPGIICTNDYVVELR